MSTIRIVRTDAIRDLFRSYIVVLDEQDAAKVRRGETVDIDAHAGAHRLRVRIDFLTSPTVEVDLGVDEVAEFLIQPKAGPALGLAGLISRRGDYISIERTA